MKIVLGADHGGFELKESIKKFLQEQEYELEDAGNVEFDREDDYVDFAEKVAREVGREGSEIGQRKIMGVLMCRSAAGMVIAANKISGVRAVAAFDVKSARHSREHNDANVLALSGDWLSEEKAKSTLKEWLEVPYSNAERHTRRLRKILDLEK